MAGKNASPLVGRIRELERLEQLAADGTVGEPRAALITGEVGIGKSRLIRELCSSAETRGALVLFGSSPPIVGADIPFAPVAQMLRGLSRQVSGESLARVRTNAPELASLAPSTLDTDLAPARSDGSSVGRLYEQFLGLLARDLVGDRRLALIVFDDIQWADPATLGLLAFLVRNLRDERVLLIATYRPEGDRPLVAQLVAELSRLPGVDRISLEPLDRDSMRELIQRRGGAALAPDDVEHIVTLTSGNPLFAEELTDSLGTGGRLPTSLRELVESRVAALPADAARVLRLVAAAGARIHPAILYPAFGGPEPLVTAATKRLYDDGLLVEADDDRGVITFRHPLVRLIVYEDTDPAERAALHRSLASALAVRTDLPLSPVERLTELAIHWERAHDYIRAFPALLHAAGAAEDVYAFTQAYELYRRAIDLSQRSAADQERRARSIGFEMQAERRGGAGAEWLTMYARAARAAAIAGELDQARRWIDAAFETAPPGSPERRHLQGERAALLLDAGLPDLALADYRQLHDQGEVDDPDRTRRLVGHARCLLALGQADEALEMARSAVAQAAAGPGRSERYEALVVLGTALAATGAHTEALETLGRARESLASRVNNSLVAPRPSRIMEIVGSYGDASAALGRAGRRHEALEAAIEGAREAARLGARGLHARLEVAVGERLFESGQWAQALARCEEALGADPRAPEPMLLRARIAVARGAWEAASADLSRLADAGERDVASDVHVVTLLTLAEMALWRRQLAVAAGIVEETQAAVGSRLDPDREVEIGNLAVRLEVERALEARAMRAGVDARRGEHAARQLGDEVESLLRAAANRLSARGANIARSTRAELTRLDAPAEGDAWSAVEAGWTSLAEPFGRAYAGFRLAEAKLRQGDRAGASAALTTAESLASDLEAAPLLAEIAALARRGRLDLRPPSAPEAEPSKSRLPGGISERELEVLRLVARGHTNRQIADELFITEKTAGHHVSNILAKLDVASRVEAAAVAHRLGLTEASDT